MHDALHIANFFIQKGLSENQPITSMKLQKLLYFAYGWHLFFFNKKLFNEVIQAWDYGPVIYSVYQGTIQFGINPLNDLISNIEFIPGVGIVDKKPILNQTTNKELTDFLEVIWKSYGKFNDLQLSNMTHECDAPWVRVFEKNNGEIPINEVIPDPLIMDYFKELAT